MSLSASRWTIVQRISAIELIYPNIKLQGLRSSDDLRRILHLPLPVTLEELFYGVTKKMIFFRVGNNQQSGDSRSKIHLDVNVREGISAGRGIEIRLGRGWPFGRLCFLIHEGGWTHQSAEVTAY